MDERWSQFIPNDPLPLIDPRQWDGQPIPPRKWIVEGLIPDGVVTNLSGDGGTGKTLAAIQVITAMSLGLPWFGKPVQQGPALLYTAEDDAPELHRRFAAVVASSGHRLADLSGCRSRRHVGHRKRPRRHLDNDSV